LPEQKKQTTADVKSPGKKEPLKISCSNHDCERELHCYSRTIRGAPKVAKGACKACGAETVDWKRVRRRALNDVSFTFDALKHEWIRHHFFHAQFDEVALRRAHKKGRIAVLASAEKIVRQRVGAEKPYRDGMQTPFGSDVMNYALHATAGCCRKCVEVWHGIPQGQALTDAEVAYLASLVRLFLEERLAEVNELPPAKPQRTARKKNDKKLH
jgi:hypothetical protein